MPRSYLHGYSDAYIVVKGDIIVVKKNIYCWWFSETDITNLNASNTDNENNIAFGKKKLVFKNKAPFICCI